jgi:ATP-dependent DNA helicase RecG
MRDYGYVDARGMGVRRKIVPLTRDFAGKDAGFELTDDYLRVVIPSRQRN